MMLVNGFGRNSSKKTDRIDSALARNNKLFGALLNRNIKNNYEAVTINTLSSITIDNNPVFVALKSEIEIFNEQVRQAIQDKTLIPDYNWKYSLFTGLRNLLKEVVSTEDINLKLIFLDRAKQWYAEKMSKKGIMTQQNFFSRRDTGHSVRPITPETRPFTAMTKTITARTSRMGDVVQTSVNSSMGHPEMESLQVKSFFELTREEVPSKTRADILRDYNEGARTLHGTVEPPPDRLPTYERKVPQLQSILKPQSRSCQRPSVSKRASFITRSETKPPTYFKSPSQEKFEKFFDSPMGRNGEENPEQEEGSQAGEDGDEGSVAPKAGIVTPARRLFMDDRVTASEAKVFDMNIPMESRSVNAKFATSQSTPELRLEYRWREAMHSKVAKSREKLEFVTMMQSWSHTKGRLQEEIGRRNESNSYGSKFHLRTFVPRAKSANLAMSLRKKLSKDNLSRMDSYNKTEADCNIASFRDVEEISEKSPTKELDTPTLDQVQEVGRLAIYRETGEKKVGRPEIHDFSNIRPKSVLTGRVSEVNQPARIEHLEIEMKKLKVEKIKKLHADLIFLPRKVPVDVGLDGAYSVDRPTSLSVYDQTKVTNYKPFSTVIEGANPELSRRSQMQEVEDVKSKLAKFQIKVPTKHLKKAILVPETSNLPQLPIPGTSLLMNPFFKETKGGKKKKGAKKKN